MADLLKVRDEFNRQLEAARAEGVLTKSAEALATIRVGSALFHSLSSLGDTLREALIVPKVDFDADDNLDLEAFTVTVSPAPGKKCERCWFVLEDVGEDTEHPTLSGRQAAIVRELVTRG